MADVNVSFGASVDGLVSGVTQVREQIEGLRSPVEGFLSSLSGVGEAIGVAFAVDKLRQFAVEMAELGERTLNASSILGLSLPKYAQLSTALQLAGADSGTAQRALERLATTFVQAADKSDSKAGVAFRNLGISQQQVTAGAKDLGVAFDVLATKYAEAEGGPRLIAAMSEILSRRLLDALIPALRQGGEGFDELKEKGGPAADVLAKMAPLAADTKEKLNLLGVTANAAAQSFFGALKPAIDAIIDGLTVLISKAAAATAGLRSMIAEGSKGMIGDMQRWLGGGPLYAEPSASAELPPVDVQAKRRPVGTETAGGGRKGAAGPGLVELWRQELEQRLEAEGNYFNSSKAEELAFWVDKRTLTENGSKEQIQVDRNIYQLRRALAHQAEADAIEDANAKIARAQQAFSSEEKLVQAEVSLGRMTAKEGIISERELVEAKWQLDQEYYAQKLEAAIADAATTKKIQDEQEIAHAKYVDALQDLDIKSAAASQQAWQGIVSPIESAISTSVTGIIQGTTTAQQAFAKLADSILASFVNSAVKGALDKLAAVISGSLVGGTGQDFSGGINGAGELVEGAGASFGIGSIFKGLASFLPIFDKGGIVPSAQGGWSLPSLGSGGVLAQLHSNEMVLPADISQGLQGMIAGGGPGGVSVNISAIDSQDVRRFFTNNGALLVTALNKAMRNGSFARVG